MGILKFFLYFILALLLLAIFLLFFTPTLLSSHTAKDFVLSKVNQSIAGKINVQNVSLGWLSGQIIEGVSLKDPVGKTIVSIEEIKTDDSLLQILLHRNLTELTEIKNGETILSRGENGVTNLEAALSSRDSPITPQGRLTTIELAQVQGEFNPVDKTIQGSGKTSYNNKQGSFTVDGSLSSPIHLTVKSEQFPVEILDQIVALKDPKWGGTLITLLGDTVNLEVDHTAQSGGSSLNLKIESPLMQGDFSAQMNDKQINLQTNSPLVFTLTPNLVQKVLQNLSAKNMISIQNTVQGSLKLDRLVVPLAANKEPRLAETDVKGLLQLGSMQITIPGKDTVDLSQISYELETPSNSSQLVTRLTAKGAQKAQSLDADIKMVAHKGLLDPTFTDSSSQQHLKYDFTIKGLPTQMVENMVGTDPILSSRFGPSLNIIGNALAQGKAISAQFSLAGEKITIPNTEIKLEGVSLPELLHSPASWNQVKGFLGVQAQPEAGITPKIEIPWSYNGQSVQYSVNAKQFPLSFVTQLAGLDKQMKKKIQVAFGPKLDINGAGQYLSAADNVFKGTIQGSQGSIFVDGQAKQGVFYLNQPLQTQFLINPEFSKEVLEPFIPLLGSALHADQPVKITVSNQNFAFPFLPMNPKAASVGKVTVDLGKMYFSSDGEIASILGLLNIRSKDDIFVWFTPIYAEFTNQTLNVQRFDFLAANKFHLASWGKVDFGQDKLRMIIGLSGQAFSRAFMIPSLDPTAMMQIPVRGSPSSPKLDLTKVATKLSALAAMATGPQGLMIGAAIDILSSLREEKTPDPTTKPFPWGSMQEETTTENTQKNPVKSVQDGVQKGVQEVLKKVLPFM